MEEEIFVSSLVAQVNAEKLSEIRTAIEAMPYAEVPLFEESGKLVILLDAPSLRDLVAITDQIQDLPDVYSVFPVYQHDEKSAQSEKSEENLETNIQIPVVEGRI